MRTRVLAPVFRSFLSLSAFILFAACAAGTAGPGGPPGDYGDAPDGGPTQYPSIFAQVGQFPTLSASNGANTQDLNGARLGPDVSAENDANDPADSDGQPNLNPVNTDSDDGPLRMVLQIVSIPPPAFVDLQLTVPAGGRSGQYWLNMLIDMNMDGEWGGTAAPGNPEWVVQNVPITLTAGQSIVYRTDYFAYGNGNRLPDPAWMRVTLTAEPAPGPNWTGEGTFSAGEVEDHLLRMPENINGDPKTVVHMDCNPPIKLFPAGVNALPFRCTLTNLTRVPGPVNYWLDRQTGGVTITGPGGGAAGANVRGVVNLPAAGMVLNFTAFRGAMRSTWSYGASAVDPMSYTDDKGIIIGYGDSTGTVTFESEGEEEWEQPRMQEVEK